MPFFDPFSWMENNSKSLQDWLKIRSDLANNVFDSLPDNKTINDNYDKVDNLLSESEPSMGSFQFSQNGMFYLKYDNQVFLKNNRREDKLIIDPPNGYYINTFSSSSDGHYVAYSLFKNGLESGNIKIIDVYSGKVFSDTIENIKFPKIIWNKDNKSFFYTKQYYNPIEKKQIYGEIYLHKVGNKPEDDPVIFGQKNDLNLQRRQYPSLTLSSNSNWVISSIGAGISGYGLDLFATRYDTLSKNSQWVKIISADEKYTDFALDKNYLYLIKENTSSGFTLLRLNLDDPNRKSEEIYQWHNGPIKQFSITKNSIYLVYNENLIQKFIQIPFDNISHIQNIKLPYQSEITALFANNEQSKLLFTLQDWLIPASVFSYDEKSHKIKHYLYSVKKSLFTTKYDVEVKMVTSKDNVSVPLTIIHQKGQKLNTSSPTWLTAYGAYGDSSLPYFSEYNIVWLEMGGTIAIAHVRGGGELGPSWHYSGRGANKMNSITDFINSAEYLINKGYTNPSKLFISGRSAGGIVIGMATAKRPDLFSAVAIDAGMLNTSKLDKIPIGIMNYQEFGSPLSQQGRDQLKKIDTYLNITDGVKYPPMMFTIGLDDERVSIWQTGKVAAKLEKINKKLGRKNRNLVLSYENTGHFFGNDSFIIKFFMFNIHNQLSGF